MIKCKIKKGDKVIVLSGKDKGRSADVIKMLPKEGKVLVQGINVVKRHVKPNPQKGETGGIKTKEMFMDISKVSLLDPKTGKPTKVGYRFNKDGKKERFARKSGEVIDG